MRFFSNHIGLSSLIFISFIIILQSNQLYAKPLSLNELNEFVTWVQCSERCEEEHSLTRSPTYEEQEELYGCMQECKAPARIWEKDGTRSARADGLPSRMYSIDRHDMELAILEYQADDQNETSLICYPEDFVESTSNRDELASRVVIPGSLCPYEGNEAEDEAGGNYDGCPHLQFVSKDLHDVAICNQEKCQRTSFSFDEYYREIQENDSNSILWFSSSRPLACPQVVCDLFESDEGGEGQLYELSSRLENALVGTDRDTSDSEVEDYLNTIDDETKMQLERSCEPSDDTDGQAHVPHWLNDHLNRQGLTPCDLRQSGGFECQLNERCVYDGQYGRGICQRRTDCPNGECSALHLELKSETDQEIIVWIYFDHSDAPVRVLDLHLNYPRSQMVLADARRLPALIYSGGVDGKEIATTHLADSTLRVSVFDSNSSDPIPYGPLVELVFQRTGQYGVCHDLNQNLMRDLLFDPERACHSEFVACERAAETDRSANFDVYHVSSYSDQDSSVNVEGQSCFNALMECLDVPLENRSSQFHLINPTFEARSDLNGDGDINAADQYYNEDSNRDGWVDARDCEDFMIRFTDREDLRSMSMAPNSDQAREQLQSDSAWGSEIQLRSRINADVKLKLWYDFSNDATPLKYKAIPSAEELCALISECANEPEESFKQKYIRNLRKLQGGVVSFSDSIAGVEQQAAYFDGSRSHIQMPIVIDPELQRDAQSFSFSTWFYAEGNSEYEQGRTQVLFAHNDFSERTRFGLWLKQSEDDPSKMDLEFFDDDYLGYAGQTLSEPVLISSIDKRRWTHLAINFDMETRQIIIYIDGKVPSTLTSPISIDEGVHPFTCPQFNRGVDLILHEEGDFLGGKPSDALYISLRKSGTYQIEEWSSTSNEARRVVLNDGAISYRDVDYNPIVDRLVYSSNETGSYEIWMSDSQGNQQQQLTIDFGDASRNIQARNPRWAPNGSGIIFESNVFDVLATDNVASQVFHLYYIAYDAREQKVAIPLLNGTKAEQLNYTQRLQDQSLVFYRLTDLDQVHHHRKVRWIEGSYDVDASENGTEVLLKRLGRVVYEYSTPTYQDKRIMQIVLDEQIPLSSFSEVQGLTTGGVIGEEVSLLDVHHSTRNTANGTVTVDRLFYKKSYSDYVDAVRLNSTNSDILYQNEQGIFKLEVDPGSSANEFVATVSYQISDTVVDIDEDDERTWCWDHNGNGLRDGIEDLDKNGIWDKKDCHEYSLSNLYLAFDSDALAFEKETLGSSINTTVESATVPYSKKVTVGDLYIAGESFVSLQIASPYNTFPLIPEDNEQWLAVAKIKFTAKYDGETINGVIAALGQLKTRETHEEYMVKADATPSIRCWDLNFNGLDDVGEDRNDDGEYNEEDCGALNFDALGKFELLKDGVFSPNGDALLLNVITQSRPVLLYNPDLISTQHVERLSQDYPKTAGLSWRKEEKFAPCQWIAAYRHPTNKSIIDSFRGGLDEFKYFTGLRSIDSIRSEYSRGYDWLERQSMTGRVPSRVPVCGNNHSECPPYHLCINQTCQLKSCVDETSSVDHPLPNQNLCRGFGGQCTLLPVTIAQDVEENSQDFTWVCAADCNFDRECYTQNCLNGPCLYCDRERSTCSECRDTEVNINGAVIRRTEGCPDERTFYCDAGACLTECYSFEDDQSLYLCDPVTEYCNRGRCVLNEWSWQDLSPMTWVSAFDAQYDLDPTAWNHYTTAIGEKYPLAIHAYGVGDYGQHPEVLVEVSGGPYYGLSSHVLGRVSITNRTQDEANQNPIVLDSSHPYTNVKLRLIQSPYSNVMNAATGLGVHDKDFCLNDLRQSGITEVAAEHICQHRAQGSRYNLGYRVGIPTHESTKACRDHGHAGCPSQGMSEHDYLYGGTPGVVIVEMMSSNSSIMNNKRNNRICSYEGSASPIDTQGHPKKIFYGPFMDEISNQLEQYCLQSDEACLFHTTHTNTAVLPMEEDVIVLNCNYRDQVQDDQSASVEFINIPEPPLLTEKGNIVLDNGDLCLIELDALRNTTCYEWYGGAVSLDPYTIPVTNAADSLDLSVSLSFAEGKNKAVRAPRYNVALWVEANDGLNNNDVLLDGLMITDVLNPEEGSDLTPRFGDNGQSNYQVIENHPIKLQIISQPNTENLSCRFVDNYQTTLTLDAVNSDQEIALLCTQSYVLKGCIKQSSDVCSSLPLLTEVDSKPVSLQLEIHHSLDADQTDREWRTIKRTSFNLSSRFAFEELVDANSQYRITVTQSPVGYQCSFESTASHIISSSIFNQAPNELSIICNEVPTYFARYQVDGLDNGEVLIVKHVETGLLQEVTTSDLNTLNQPPESFAVTQGTSYTLQVAQQPAYQECSVHGGIGTESNHLRIHCVDLERGFASISLIGVPINKQVAIQLEMLMQSTRTFVNEAGVLESEDVWIVDSNRTQTIVYAQGRQIDPTAETIFRFDHIGMIDGDRYRLRIDTDQTSDEVVCSVGTEITNPVQSKDFEFMSAVDGTIPRSVNCQDQALLDSLPQFNLAGTIRGLGNRDGLRLIAFEAGQALEIDAGSTSFSFADQANPLVLSRNDSYDVQVGRQPEGAYCTVNNGSGEIQADVDDIEVSCEPAYNVRINLSNMDGLTSDDNVGVKVQLFSSSTSTKNSRLVAQSDDSVIIDDNASATIDLQDLDDQLANLPGGTYHLYVWVNMDNSTDSSTGDPTFNGEDKALYQSIQLNGNQVVTTLSYSFSDFTNVVPVLIKVPISSDSIKDNEDYQNASMECMISHSDGINVARGIRGIPYPRADYRPIISTATRVCTEECDSDDAIDAMYITNYPGYAVSGSPIDVFCIVDKNSDNILNRFEIYAIGDNIIPIPTGTFPFALITLPSLIR